MNWIAVIFRLLARLLAHAGGAEYRAETADPWSSPALTPTKVNFTKYRGMISQPQVPLNQNTTPCLVRGLWFKPVSRGLVCGADRNRTDDPLLAKQVL